MKKVALLLSFCAFVAFAQAQTTTPPQKSQQQETKAPSKRIEIKQADLKQEIKDYITKNYAEYTFINAFQIDGQKGEIRYRVVVKKDQVKKAIIFNKDGVFVKESTMEPRTPATPTKTE